MKIGFAGLGIMGRPMSGNLVKAGFPVTVWNRTQSKTHCLADAGADVANSPKELAERSDVIITIVTDSPEVKQVVLGEGGVIEGARANSVVIDMSTISPAATREIAEDLALKGIHMLDAPVSGGDKGAIEGTLSIMVGGPKADFDRCLPIFQAMGKNIIHMGDEHGMGQATKACNQVIGILNILAVGEGLMLAHKSGLDLNRMLQAVGAGAAGSWMVNNLGPKMAAHDFEPGFIIRLQQKDLNIVLETAKDLNLPMPGTSLAHQLLRSVEAEGLGEKGTSAFIRALEKLADCSLV
ncbi:MAG: 2-hydroxy-3-oxopropionate reductase [Armatimonadetes bacterium CG07_land_8_20_14_0_80_59_28]|nr:MAG: 2-hydroxy-3-oxopropionate reductase [Armatimonadetes bacterium CG07_land_8_20_14_0_80_59_28]PIX42276.1 MAG: 2-hydroxy-3-oxopropionate reductase [Armatimonadetes bacterium CG_4_8_14_3_um_filter_58_9]PIY44041.1 MAG: 2-hydroxy-3-oxopropionate reductase [Armatimonadetes bacterium CG_4_10_14_3_um_filter_59_10]PJB66325.1 MAG: 2-hydroxy-3-oxopropionate reductase [Armatimonadetes bacterium CG_4_9_14_3_um_filter_58_7]